MIDAAIDSETDAAAANEQPTSSRSAKSTPEKYDHNY